MLIVTGEDTVDPFFQTTCKLMLGFTGQAPVRQEPSWLPPTWNLARTMVQLRGIFFSLQNNRLSCYSIYSNAVLASNAWKEGGIDMNSCFASTMKQCLQ